MKDRNESPPPPTPPTLRSRHDEPPPRPPSNKDVDLMREEFKPIGEGFTLMQVADALLRSPGRVAYELSEGRRVRVSAGLLATAAICFCFYGMIMGTYSGGHQVWAVPLKITLGSLFSALICFPSLYIFSSLGRVKIGLTQLAGLLMAMIALNALLLVGFSPVSWLFSQATESVTFLGTMHLSFWLAGLYFGVRLLSRSYQLVAGHTTGFLSFWCVVYVMVSLQVITNLRPLLGEWDGTWATEKMFFLEHFLRL